MVINFQKKLKELKRLKKKPKAKGLSKEKILKKPHAKVPSYSAVKVVRSIASSTPKLVKEVEQREIIPDNRSLFFKSEMEKERRGMMKWI